MSAPAKRLLNGVVVSAGLMQKTVKVRTGKQEWNKYIRKYFSRKQHFLVHDPSSSLRVGDVINFQAGWRVSKRVRHVVSSIVAPFGTPVEERPPVPTEEERLAEKERLRSEKVERRANRDREGKPKIEHETRRGVEKGRKAKAKAKANLERVKAEERAEAAA